MSSQTGQSYGPYRVVRPLGGGGMGTVLLAEDSRLGRKVALKTVTAGSGSTPESRDRLLHEARAAARLSHPNIAAVHDVLDIDGEMIIVFEYVEGETLAARIARGRLPVDDALRIGAQLADALAAAHSLGVVHRDLKPGNVMLTPDGTAKILDFGIARSLPLEQDETSVALTPTESPFAGTPAYAAPEQWLGELTGPHTDVFALGMVLFEMLTGRRPFQSGSRLELMQQVIEAPRPHVRELNPHVPASVDALVDAALCRDPARRPAGARDMANLLRSSERDWAGTESGGASRLSWRWIAVAAAILAVIIATMVGMLRTQSEGSRSETPVVAVLPLANVTGTPTNDYVAAGVADSLTTSLASLNSITVLSRAAVMGAWTRQQDPSKLAKELGATYLVEGSVQQVGDQVKLSVNLVKPDRSLAWADSVEGPFARVLDLQSRLAASLGRALSVRVSEADRAKLAQQPTNNPDALAEYWRGRALLERRDVGDNLDTAVRAFDRAIELDPEFGLAYASRGEALWVKYEQTRDPQLARAAIDAGTTALRIDPDRPNVRYSLALTLAGSGRLDDAIDELQRALALQPNFEDARVQLARVLGLKGNIDEAVSEYRKVIDRRPDYAAPYSAMGRTLYDAGRYREAADAFERVTALQPDNVIAYQQTGVSYQALGDNAHALEFYEKALAIRPYAPAYSMIGAIHHQQGEYAQAVAAYKQAIAIRPNARETHRNLGDAYAKMGLHKEAQLAYREAVRLAQIDLQVNPRDPRLLSGLAVYLQKAGEPVPARQRIEEAMKLAPADFDVLHRAAQVHALAGRSTDALDALEAAIRNGLRRDTARTEDEFESLRKIPRFTSITKDSG